MGGILLLMWLSFLATSLSMSQHNECNFMEQVIQSSQDFQICVCLNQVYINCTLNGASAATKNLSKEEEICYRRLVKLPNTSGKKTCVCSKLKECHSEEQLALHKATCARKAVMKIYPILSQLKIFCCDLQNVLLKLWFRLEERVFLRLVKSISHDSLDTVIFCRRLRMTKWCKAFHTECLEADLIIRKGCTVRTKLHRRHKRDIEESQTNYKTEFEPFSTATTKRLQDPSKKSTTQSTTEEMTPTTSAQTTRMSRSTATTGIDKERQTLSMPVYQSTLPPPSSTSTATTGIDKERQTLSMPVYQSTLPPPSSSSSLSSSSSSSSSSLSSSSSSLLSSSSSSLLSSSATSSPSSSISSSATAQGESSQRLLSSTLSSSLSHVTQNPSPLRSFIEPSTSNREQTNTAGLQTTLLSSTVMATYFKDQESSLMVEQSTSLLPSVAMSSAPSVASSSKVASSKVESSSSSKVTLTSSETSKPQLDDLPSRWHSSLLSSTSLRIEDSPLLSYTSYLTSSSSSPTPRNWPLGVTTLSPDPSTGQEMSSSEATAEPLFSEYLSNKTYDMTAVKQTSTHLASKTKTLTPSMVDHELTGTSDSSNVRTLTPELHHISPTSLSMREVSSAPPIFDRQISDNKIKTSSVSLLATSSFARRSTLLRDADIHSKYVSKITLDKRESLDITPSSSITVVPPTAESDKIKSNAFHTSSHISEPLMWHKSEVSIAGFPSTRTEQIYGSTSVNVARSSSIRVLKPTPRMTLTSISPAPGTHMTIPLSSLETIRELTARKGSYQTSSSLTTSTTSLPSLPKLLFSLSVSSASTSMLTLSSSSSTLSSSPSLSITASESSPGASSETEPEISISKLNTSLPSAMSSSIHISESQISISSLHLSTTSTSTLSSLPRSASSLSPSSSQTFFITGSQLSSAMSSRSLVSSASVTSHEDTSFTYSMVHLSSSSSSSLHKPLNLTSLTPTPPSWTASLTASTTSLNYTIFAKGPAMGKMSDTLSSITSSSYSPAISTHLTTSLTEHSYLATSSHYSSVSSLNQTMPMKSPVLLAVSSSSSSSLSQPSSSSSSSPLSSQPSSSSPSSQPLSSLPSSSLLPSPSSQPLSLTSASSLPSQPLSSSRSSRNVSLGWQVIVQVSKRLPLSTQNETTKSLVKNQSTIGLRHSVPPLSLTASFAPSSSASAPASPSLILPYLPSSSMKSFFTATSVSVFISSSHKSSMLLLSPVSSSLKSSPTPSSLPSATSVSFLLSSSQSFILLTPVASLLAPSSTSLPSTLLSSSLMSSSSSSLTPVSSLLATPSSTSSPSMLSSSLMSSSSSLSSTPVSSLLATPSSTSSPSMLSSSLMSSSSSLSSTPASSREIMTSSLSLTTLPSTSSSLSSTLSLSAVLISSSSSLPSPVSSSLMSLSPSLSSTPPLSSILILSSSLSLTTSVPISMSSSMLATPSLSSSLIPSSLSSSLSSSLMPSSLRLLLSQTPASTSLVSSSSLSLASPSLPSLSLMTSVSLMPSSSTLPPESSVSTSLMPSSLKLSVSPTPSSIIMSTTNVQLPKNDTVAKNIFPSKTLLVQQPSSPLTSEEPLVKEMFLAVFDGNCLEVTSRKSFKSAFIDTITNLIGLDNDQIDILDIRCGSIEVLFYIKRKQTSKIAEVFDRLVKEEKINIVFNGKTYRAISITSLHPTTTRPTILSPSFTNPTINVLTAQINERRLVKIMFVLFVSIFGALTLFGVVICIARICGRRRYAKLRLKTSTLSSRGTNQIYKNELELIRMSPLHRYADYYGGTNQEAPPKEESDDEEKINNRTALLNMLRNGEIASRRGKIMVKDDDSYSSIAFY